MINFKITCLMINYNSHDYFIKTTFFLKVSFVKQIYIQIDKIQVIEKI